MSASRSTKIKKKTILSPLLFQAPTDVILHILSFLCIEDLISFSETSKQSTRFALYPPIIKKRAMHDFRLTAEKFEEQKEERLDNISDDEKRSFIHNELLLNKLTYGYFYSNQYDFLKTKEERRLLSLTKQGDVDEIKRNESERKLQKLSPLLTIDRILGKRKEITLLKEAIHYRHSFLLHLFYEKFESAFFDKVIDAYLNHTEPKALKDQTINVLYYTYNLFHLALLCRLPIADLEFLIVQHKFDVNEICNKYGAPLHIAATTNYLEAAQLLLRFGAKINLIVKKTPLATAAKKGNLAVLTYLVRENALALEKKISGGSYPLLVAIDNNQIEAAKILIESGADLTTPDFAIGHGYNDHFHALALATIRNQFDVVSLLLEKKANVNQLTKFGRTALWYAARFCKEEIFNLLLKYQADPSIGKNPLIEAIPNGIGTPAHENIVRTLLKYLPADLTDPEEYAPLSETGNVVIAKMLIAAGANIHRLVVGGQPTLARLIERSRYEKSVFDVINLLLECGLDIQTSKSDYLTHAVRTHVSAKLIKLLLRHQAPYSKALEYTKKISCKKAAAIFIYLFQKNLYTNHLDTYTHALITKKRFNYSLFSKKIPELNAWKIDTQGKDIESAYRKTLYHCIALVYQEVSRQSGKHISLIKYNGCTLLHHAIALEQPQKIILNLLSKGFSHSKHDEMSAAMIAALLGREYVIKIFLDQGLSANFQQKNHYALLNASTFNGNIESCKLLLDRGADLTTYDGTKTTPLITAAKSNHINLVELFLQRNTITLCQEDLKILNQALRTAIRKEHEEITKMILKYMLKKYLHNSVKSIKNFFCNEKSIRCFIKCTKENMQKAHLLEEILLFLVAHKDGNGSRHAPIDLFSPFNSYLLIFRAAIDLIEVILDIRPANSLQLIRAEIMYNKHLEPYFDRCMTIYNIPKPEKPKPIEEKKKFGCFK